MVAAARVQKKKDDAKYKAEAAEMHKKKAEEKVKEAMDKELEPVAPKKE